jgi:hypothetical protein
MTDLLSHQNDPLIYRIGDYCYRVLLTQFLYSDGQLENGYLIDDSLDLMNLYICHEYIFRYQGEYYLYKQNLHDVDLWDIDGGASGCYLITYENDIFKFIRVDDLPIIKTLLFNPPKKLPPEIPDTHPVYQQLILPLFNHSFIEPTTIPNSSFLPDEIVEQTVDFYQIRLKHIENISEGYQMTFINSYLLFLKDNIILLYIEDHPYSCLKGTRQILYRLLQSRYPISNHCNNIFFYWCHKQEKCLCSNEEFEEAPYLRCIRCRQVIQKKRGKELCCGCYSDYQKGKYILHE